MHDHSYNLVWSSIRVVKICFDRFLWWQNLHPSANLIIDQICQHNSLIFIKWWRIKNNSSQIGLKNTTHIHHTVNTTLIVTELYNYKFQLVGGSLRWTSNEYGTLWLSEQQLCIKWYFSEKKTFWSFMYTD